MLDSPGKTPGANTRRVPCCQRAADGDRERALTSQAHLRTLLTTTRHIVARHRQDLRDIDERIKRMSGD